MTVAERALWAGVRKLDLNVRRQAPIGRFVADFAHHSAKLVVEIDGYYHALPENAARDAERGAWLRGEGYLTLLIPDADVHRDLNAVLQLIEATVHKQLASRLARTPIPDPSPIEGEGSSLPPSRGA